MFESKSNDEDLSSLPDEAVLDAIRNAPGEVELTKSLHKRIAKMCDACYEQAMYILIRQQTLGLSERDHPNRRL